MSSSFLKFFNSLQSRLVLGLIFISLVFVLSPLFQRYSSLNRIDILFISLVFSVVIILESIVILFLEYFEFKHKSIQNLSCLITGLFLGLNIFNFYFVLTSLRPYIFFLIYLPLALVLIYSKYSKNSSKYIIQSCLVMIIVMGISEVPLGFKNVPESNSLSLINKDGNAKRSIYFISFDALVSRKALTELYQANERPHIDFLESSDFALYDIDSPGVDTTNSFVEWFSFGTLHWLRNHKDYFNGMIRNPLYARLTNIEFKKQFVSRSNYFGIDMELIDSFHPKNYSISICEFMNARYAFGLCHGYIYNNFLKPILLTEGNLVVDSESKLDGHEFVAKNLKFASSEDPSKWFSVSYISFPGHASSYLSNDTKSIENYRLGYLEKLPELKNQFQVLFNLIRDKDPTAVIVFVGDHGGYLTGRWELFDKDAPEGGSKRMFDLDRSSVLMGVYPRSFCKNELSKIQNSSELMKILSDCAL